MRFLPSIPSITPPLLALALVGCVQEQTLAAKLPCEIPSANVGDDLSITLGNTAQLSAEPSVCKAECEKAEPTITWNLDAVPPESALDNSAIISTDPTAPYFQPDVVGTYVVSVTVADCFEDTEDAHEYIVIDVTSGNAKPIADCGENHSTQVDSRVDLDGSASSDPDGAALTYDWALSSVPACSTHDPSDIFNGTTSMASVVPDCAGVYVVGLTVSDGENLSEPAFCTVTASSSDEMPIADAGLSRALSPCTEMDFQLDGYGSYDPEGEALTYEWTLVSAPAESGGFGAYGSGAATYFNDPTNASPYFHWDVPGDYTFQLAVSDGVQGSAPDIVTFTFQDQSLNEPPIANAGDDQSVTVDTECTTSSYTWTCEDCPSKKVTLDGTASDDPVDGDDLDFLWEEKDTRELTIVAPYSPQTSVYTPAFASEYNVATTRTWQVDLTVNDCADDDDDHVTITYACTGTYTP